MASTRMVARSQDWKVLFNIGSIAGLSDAQLLDRFLSHNGEAAELAFSALVERHGPMVHRVVRGVLPDVHDAQDAFQATFLILVRQVRRIRNRESLASWLHGVALRVATSARSASMRRSVRDRRVALAESAKTSPLAADVKEVCAVVHEEIDRLPERFRCAIVLCDLQEKTHEQAAEQLGWPVGTVKSRLSRGRDRLRGRFLRRGLAPATFAAGIGIGTSGEASAATLTCSIVSQALVRTTTTAAMEFATGQAGSGLYRASAAYLAQGVLKMLSIQTGMRRLAVALALCAATVAMGWGLLTSQAAKPVADQPAKPTTPPKEILYTLRFLQVDGLQWREDLDNRLNFQDQMESQTVWTVNTAEDINAIYKLSPAFSPKKEHEEIAGSPPKLTAYEGATAQIVSEQDTRYVSNVQKTYDGDSEVAFAPLVRKLTHGDRAEISGRIRADGILLKAKVQENLLIRIGVAISIAESKDKTKRYRGTIQIPEVIHREVTGEWLVPRGGALVVSLGLHHTTGRFGFDKVCERLAVIVPTAVDDLKGDDADRESKPETKTSL